MKRAMTKNFDVLAPNIMAGRKDIKFQKFHKFMQHNKSKVMAIKSWLYIYIYIHIYIYAFFIYIYINIIFI